MRLARDILASYRAPARQMRRLLAEGRREERALAMLMGALALFFLAKWPELLRASRLDPQVPFDARVGGALMGLLFLMPLFAYALAAFAQLLMRLTGGGGSWYGNRLALFWSLLAISPLSLIQGLLAGFLAPGPVLTLAGALVLVVFLWLWGGALWAVRSMPGAVSADGVGQGDAEPASSPDADKTGMHE